MPMLNAPRLPTNIPIINRLPVPLPGATLAGPVLSSEDMKKQIAAAVAKLQGQNGTRDALQCRIYVGSVYWDLSEDHLKSVFEVYGKIVSCQLIPVCVKEISEVFTYIFVCIL